MTDEKALEVLQGMLDAELLVIGDPNFERYDGYKLPAQALALAIDRLRDRIAKNFKLKHHAERTWKE